MFSPGMLIFLPGNKSSSVAVACPARSLSRAAQPRWQAASAAGSRGNRLVQSQAARSRSSQVSETREKVQPDVTCSPKASSPTGNAQFWPFCPCLGTRKQADHRVFFTKSRTLAEGIAAVSATLPPRAACAFRFLLSHKQLQVPTSSRGLPPDTTAWRDTLPFAVPWVPHSRSGNDCKPSAPALLLQQASGREGAWEPRLHKASSRCQLLTRLCLPERARNTTSELG